MRVLQAPVNIANQGWMNAEALRRRGHCAEVWQYYGQRFGYPADRVFGDMKDPRLVARLLVEAAAREFDVVHFHFAQSLVPAVGPLPLFWDLPLWKALGKKVVFSFHGTDVRIARIAKQLDPWSAYHFADLPCDEERIDSALAMIRNYADALTVSNVANMPYVPGADYLPLSVDLRQIEESPREPGRIPLVAHAPSARGTKGTQFVLAGFDVLRRQGVEFEVDLIEGVSNKEVLERYARADIVVEKLVNEGFGVAALEAMAIGRPVISRIASSVYEAHPKLPIIDATPDSFVDVLRSVLGDRAELVRRGGLGRAYVRENHDISLTGERLEVLYAKSLVRTPEQAGWPDPYRDLRATQQRLGAELAVLRDGIKALEGANEVLEEEKRLLEQSNGQLGSANRLLERELVEARHGFSYRVARRWRKAAGRLSRQG